MNKKNEQLYKLVDQLKDAVMGLLTVYGPATIERIKDDIHYYFPKLSNLCDNNLDELLTILYKNKIIDKSKKEYSVIPFNCIKTVDKAYEIANQLPIGDKEFTAKEILSYGSFKRMIKGKEFKGLDKYLRNIVTDNKTLEEIENNLVVFPYLFVEEDKAYEYVSDKTKNKVDENKLKELYIDYFTSVPRYFFGGFSFKEQKEELIKKYPEFFSGKKDNPIKNYPIKKDYPKFTYTDLIELGKKISTTKLYRLIDSDRILELTVNNKKVYTQILGFHHKDIGIIIYPNKEELMYSYHFVLAEHDEYPDQALRISTIEVCLGDPGGFANKEILEDMKKNNYPEYPSFIRLIANHNNRLVNEEEIQIVGGVLSDLLTYIKNNNLSDISLHLGEKKDDDYDFDQVYITEKETLYGGYNDNKLHRASLNFKNNSVDVNKVKKLKKFKKKNISIGCYIYPTIVENDDIPYVLIIRDNESGMIVDVFLKKKSEMSNIKNDMLDCLHKHEINPKSIYVNNEYAFLIFDEYMDFFDEYDYVNDDALDEVYTEMINFEFSHNKVTKKDFN